MMKETILSEEYLRAITGKFDLETIFNLELENKNIQKLGSIPRCISIVYLNLSQNKISSLDGIEVLITLNFLDLSCNCISKISPLEKLIELRTLKLYGNNINGPPPKCLEKLRKLEKLSFQTEPFEEMPNLNVTNPICSTEDYRQNIFNIMPNLKWLDNLNKKMEYFNFDLNENGNNFDEQLNLDNFEFNFSEKIKLSSEELIPDEEIENSKKEINDKYNEFEKGIEELKKELEKIK